MKLHIEQLRKSAAFNFATSEAKDSGKGTAYQDYKNTSETNKYNLLISLVLNGLGSNKPINTHPR